MMPGWDSWGIRPGTDFMMRRLSELHRHECPPEVPSMAKLHEVVCNQGAKHGHNPEGPNQVSRRVGGES
eukprot:5665118-Karenia_brevis.AAC.1